MLSPLAPVFEYTPDGIDAYVEVQNFGEIDSSKSQVRLIVTEEAGEQVAATATVRPLAPFEKSLVRLVCDERLLQKKGASVVVILESEGLPLEALTSKIELPRIR